MHECWAVRRLLEPLDARYQMAGLVNVTLGVSSRDRPNDGTIRYRQNGRLREDINASILVNANQFARWAKLMIQFTIASLETFQHSATNGQTTVHYPDDG